MSDLSSTRAAVHMRDYRKRRYLNRGPLKVSTDGVARRLQALHALGWTCVDMGNEMGLSKSRVAQLMSGSWYPNVFLNTARQVFELYDKLCMTVPTDSTDPHSKVHVHQRARNRARRLGYVPPLAWDDIDNDPAPREGWDDHRDRDGDDVDPVVVERVLSGERLATTRAERRIIVGRWLAAGGSEKALCDRMGWRAGRYTPADDLGVSA